MKPPTRIPLRPLTGVVNCPYRFRDIHSTIGKAANVAPIVGTGPPPQPPSPTAAKVLQQAKALRNAKNARNGTQKNRFWDSVHVKEVNGSLQILLDARPLRHPQTKEIIQLPLSKQNLASALAIEWDLLTSVQDATKHHLIPLTSLVCRALDIIAEDKKAGAGLSEVRSNITAMVLRYLDTDSILCWAPPPGPYDLKNDAGESLRDVQKKTAEDIVGYVTTHIWPGIEISPVLDGHSIFPQPQNEGVREVVQGWVSGLSAWEIAGLERAVLAGKSLIAAARFVSEWSEGAIGEAAGSQTGKFGVEEAARATNLEVDWQATQWGEVEDTHDVNKEDVRRQLGSVMLLVSGTGKTQ